MDTDTIPDVPNDNPETYCRLCFSGFYVEPLFPADAEPRQQLIELIAKHVEIQITIDTDFPCAVCRMCQMTLEGFHKYRERCLQLDDVLQRKRLELCHMRVKMEHQEELAQNAVGFEEDTIYCLSDSDDEGQQEQQDHQHLEQGEEEHENLLTEQQVQPEEDEDEEELIKGDILIKPEPYAMGEEYGEADQAVDDQQHEEEDEQQVVVLDSDEDEQSLETSTRASSVARGEDRAGEEPTKPLPFDVTSDGAYRCTICLETFRLMKEIKIHIRKDHPEESQVYSCRFCGKKFSDTGSLRVHTRFHTNDFPFSCDDCGAKFTMKKRLDTHTARYHDKDSPSYTDKRFKCTLCPRIFLQEQARNMHITHFHDVRPADAAVEMSLPNSQVFFCEPCNESFESQQDCSTHMQEHHAGGGEAGAEPKPKMTKRFKCPDCPKLFRHRTAYRSHIMINHGTMPHKCDICGSCFERKTKLTKHKERWHGENSKNKVLERYKCDQCERFFVRNQDRIRHEQIIHSIESPAKLPSVWEGRKSNFPCSKCDRKFPTMKTMRIHFALKHPEVPVRFKCTVCSKLFKHKTSLRDHMANHTGSQPYGCVHCDERFIRKKDMERHLEEVHGAEGASVEAKERFACKYCPRTLLTKTARALHVRHHHADKEPFAKQVLLSLPKSLKCTHCEKSFTSRNTLKLHVLNHLGKLPHQCDQCAAGFYKPADLLKHKQRYHTGGSSVSLASRFKCAYCPRVFIRKSARRYHHTVFHGMESRKSASTSTGSRPTTSMRIKADPDAEYPCALCTLIFVTSPMLQAHHQQQHPEQEFYFKCSHCPKRTTHRNTYLSHIKIHVGGWRHPCDECNAQFDRKITLISHKKRYHSIAGKDAQRFHCTLCTREFVRNQDRVRHQITVHNYQVQGSNSNPAPSPGPSKPSKSAVKGKGKPKGLQVKLERLPDNLVEALEQQQFTEVKVVVGSSRKGGFEVSSDVEDYGMIDDDEQEDEQQQHLGEGAEEEVSEAPVPTISNVVSIKQEAMAARKGYSEYPSEF